jgi:hypothetical protein
MSEKVYCYICRHYGDDEYGKDFCKNTKRLTRSPIRKRYAYDLCEELNKFNNCKNFIKTRSPLRLLLH